MSDQPKRHWRQPNPKLNKLTLEEWNQLKRGANHCRRCGAKDELDAWGQWHPPVHQPYCAGSRGFHATQRAEDGPPKQTPELRRPRRAFGERDDD